MTARTSAVRTMARLNCALTLILLLLQPLPAPAQNVTRDPARASIEVGDVERFVAAVAEARGKVPDIATALDAHYLADASPGLRAWVSRYGVTAATIASAMQRRPAAYAGLTGLEQTITRLEPELRRSFRELQALFPAAAFPPVWLLVGDHVAGGLTRPEGVLIAAETLAGDPDLLVPLVMHELAHFQAAMLQGPAVYARIYGPDQTLLALALREGAAEFIAYLTAGRHINPAAEAYGLPRERELWLEFSAEMHAREPGEWMFARPAAPARPADLGYWIGFRIVRSYYENASDRQSAIADILNLTDFAGFLEASGYAGRFTPPVP